MFIWIAAVPAGCFLGHAVSFSFTLPSIAVWSCVNLPFCALTDVSFISVYRYVKYWAFNCSLISVCFSLNDWAQYLSVCSGYKWTPWWIRLPCSPFIILVERDTEMAQICGKALCVIYTSQFWRKWRWRHEHGKAALVIASICSSYCMLLWCAVCVFLGKTIWAASPTCPNMAGWHDSSMRVVPSEWHHMEFHLMRILTQRMLLVHSRHSFLTYCIIQVLYAISTTLLSILFYKYFIAHSVFLAALFIFVTWNGSTFYMYFLQERAFDDR